MLPSPDVKHAVSYHAAESVILDANHVMAGHRAGHLSPRVPIEMTGLVAGHDA